MTESEIRKTITKLHLSVEGGAVSQGDYPLCLKALSSVYAEVSINALDGDWGRRETFRKDVSRLLRSFVEGEMRTADLPLERQAYLAEVSLSALRDTDLAVDSSLEEGVFGIADDVLSRYFEATLPKGSAAAEENETFFRMMRLLLVCLCGMEDGEEHPWLDFFRGKVAVWCSLVSEDGSWSGIPVEQALWRITLLDMNSYILLDGSRDEVVKRAFSHYCSLDGGISSLFLSARAATESPENLVSWGGEWEKGAFKALEGSLPALLEDSPLYEEVFSAVFTHSLREVLASA